MKGGVAGAVAWVIGRAVAGPEQGARKRGAPAKANEATDRPSAQIAVRASRPYAPGVGWPAPGFSGSTGVPSTV